jgi:hypothetical protein
MTCMKMSEFRCSCFIRSDAHPRWRQGILTVAADRITWKPFWSLRRRALPLATQSAAVFGVHEAVGQHGGLNIKEYLFRVIECRLDDNHVYELAVSRQSVAPLRQLLLRFPRSKPER